MPKLAIGALTISVLVIMAALRVADLRASRDETLRTAEARAANLSRIISAYLGGTFAAGDASLRQLALHSRRIGGPSAPESQWGPSLASARAGLTGIGAITVVDAEGIIRHSTRPEIRGQSRRDEYLVRRALTATTDDLIISTPFPAALEPRQLLIPIGRRLTREDGIVDGAVVASFFPAAPREFFQTVDLGERGTLWVFHPSGIVLFREPSAANPLGEPAMDNAIFTAASRSGASGTLRGPVVPGGPAMLSAYHSSTTPPLVAAVSLDRDEVLSEWRSEAVGSAAAFAVAALLLAATVVMLFRQMTAKADAELALQQAQQLEADHLRDANERLQSALQREQVARRDAEAASALKDQFLMTVSHELRTPLTAIYGWSRMLAEGAVSDRQKESALRTIERNALAQTRLIDDLLDVSRIMGGKLRLDVRPVNVETVVQNAVDTVKPAADAKAIRIRTVVDRGAAWIAGDRERLQQIVWNLLSNAVKFTPHGGSVDVAVVPSDGEVEIAVTDTGAGISPEFLPHVFERFRQEDAGTTRRYGGLGLGLAIVRNLVELHGGSVAASSEGVGRGATFTVRLPAPATEALAAAEAGGLGEAPESHRLDGLRVLAVDDDAEARGLFAAILQRAGAAVTCAMSAGEALQALERASYDVLISDIEMPEVDGYGLLEQARAIAGARGERLVAVAVTAYSRAADEARSLAAGFERHVQKPVDPASLIGVIDTVWKSALRDSA